MRPFDNAASMGLGGATIAYPNASLGLHNEGQLGSLTSPQVLLTSALPYGIVDWQSAQLQGVVPIKAGGGLGFTLMHAGIAAYQEQRVQVAYGRRLGKAWHLGASGFLLRTAAPEYSQAVGGSSSLSLLGSPLPRCHIGVGIVNAIPVRVAGVTLPPLFRMGACWEAATTARILAEVEKDLDRPAQIKVGLEYQPVGAFAFRVGTRTQPARVGMSVQARLKNGLALDMGTEWHTNLGLTPALMVRWKRE